MPRVTGGASVSQQPSVAYSVGAAQLPKWRDAASRVRNGAGRAKVLWAGDSTTTGAGAGASGNSAMVGAYQNSIQNQVAAILNARGLPVSSNSFLSNQSTASAATAYNAYDPRLVEGAGWADAAGFFIAGGTTFVSTGTGVLAFTPVGAVDTFEIYWYNNNNAGTATVNVNGGATLATLTGSGTQTVTKTTVTAVKGVNTLNIVGGGATQFYIMGVVAYDSTKPAVDFIQAGQFGSLSATWIANSTTPPGPAFVGTTGLLAKMAPDLIVVDLTVNDSTGATSAATYTANMTTLVSALATFGADILLVSGTPPNTSASAIATIVRALAGVAAARNLAFLDVNARWVNFTTANATGWFFSDGLHPNAVGYADVAKFLSAFLGGI